MRHLRAVLCILLLLSSGAVAAHGWQEMQPLMLKADRVKKLLDATADLQAGLAKRNFSGGDAIAWQQWLARSLQLHLHARRADVAEKLTNYGFSAEQAVHEWDEELAYLASVRSAASKKIWDMDAQALSNELEALADKSSARADQLNELLALFEISRGEADALQPHFAAVDKLIEQAAR